MKPLKIKPFKEKQIKKNIIDRKLKIKSFKEFLKYVKFEDTQKFYPLDLQFDMCDWILGLKGREVGLLLGTRGIGKSLLTMFVILWKLYNEKESRMLLVGKNPSNIKNQFELIRKHIEEYPELFGNLKINNVQRNISDVTSKMKDSRLATSTLGQTVRGMRADYIIFDDILAVEQYTINAIETADTMYKECLNLGSGNGVTVLVIGNLIGEEDLHNKLRNNPDVNKHEIWVDDLPKDCPIWRDVEDLRKQGLTEYEIATNYLGYILNDENTILGNIRIEELKKSSHQGGVIFIDPAYTDNNDYTAISILSSNGITKKDFIVEGYIFKQSWYNDKFMKSLEQIVKLHEPRIIFYEDNNIKESLILCYSKSKILNKYKFIGKSIVGRSKEYRINIIPSMIGNLIFNDKPQYKDYINQIRTYNKNSSKHDDAPDSLASCLSCAGLITF